MKNYSKEDFQANLLAADWIPVNISDYSSDAWEQFKNIFMSIVDNISPVKKLRFKQRTEPWICSDILNSINERDKAFSKYKKNKSEFFFNYF